MNRDEVRTAFAAGFTRARMEAGLSVAQVAAEAGVAPSTVKRAETRGTVRITTAVRLADVYDVSLDSLAVPA